MPPRSKIKHKSCKKLSKTTLAYIAGIIDGEGCIRVGKVNRNTISRLNHRYTLSIQITMSNKKIIKWFKNILGGGFYKHRFIKKKHPTWKLQYRWIIQNYHCEEFLKFIRPYLKIKKQHAKLALKFLKIEDGNIKEKNLYWKKFRKLNK